MGGGSGTKHIAKLVKENRRGASMTMYRQVFYHWCGGAAAAACRRAYENARTKHIQGQQVHVQVAAAQVRGCRLGRFDTAVEAAATVRKTTEKNASRPVTYAWPCRAMKN